MSDAFDVKVEKEEEKSYSSPPRALRTKKPKRVKEPVEVVVNPRERLHLSRDLRLKRSRRDGFVVQRDAVLLRLRNLEKIIEQLNREMDSIEEKLGR